MLTFVVPDVSVVPLEKAERIELAINSAAFAPFPTG